MFLSYHFVYRLDAFVRAETSQRCEYQIVENFLYLVLAIQLFVHHVFTQGVIHVSGYLVVHVFTEVALFHATLKELLHLGAHQHMLLVQEFLYLGVFLQVGIKLRIRLLKLIHL